MNERIIDILKELKPGVSIDESKKLIEDCILDSLDVMNLSIELNDEFDIEITPLDIVPENFNSVSAIAGLVQRLVDEG